MAITETGYYRPTYEDILNDLTLYAKELYGEDMDVSEQTPFGKILNIMAYREAKFQEGGELLYYSRFPNSAKGISLDRLCPFVGITRNSATPSRYEVEITGDEGTVIPFGFLVSTESGIEFYNTMESTIAEGETTCTITVECTEAGTIGNVAISDITEISNPEVGIESVKGLSVVSMGADEESDYSLRRRIASAGKGAGSCNEPAIRAALLKVPTVTTATVLVNETDETDENGLLPHSIACYVAGGDAYSYEIGEAIFNSKAAGIKTNGDITVEVVDNGGFSHTINYNHVAYIPITIDISIKTTTEYEGETGVTAIKDNLITHINSLGVGVDVYFTELYGLIYSVNGVERVNSLKLSTDGATFVTEDIAITELECAIVNAVNVTEV